jgi:hypothetical protein
MKKDYIEDEHKTFKSYQKLVKSYQMYPVENKFCGLHTYVSHNYKLLSEGCIFLSLKIKKSFR